MPALSSGQRAPDFAVRRQGSTVTWLRDLRGRPVLVRFVGTGSAPCESVDADPGLFVVFVGGAAAAEGDTGGTAQVSRVPDPDGGLAALYGAGDRAMSFLVDEAGIIAAVFDAEPQRDEEARDPDPIDDGARPSMLAPAKPRAGAVVQHRYRLVEVVSSGGMSEVWRATHTELLQEVALKIALPPPPGAAGDWIDMAVRRFRFEAQVSARICRRTEHVVPVVDAGYDAVGPFMVMPLVRGRALDEEIAERGPLSPVELGVVLDQVGEALEAAHAEGIVHRVVKPAKVLVTRGGATPFVQLIDFGIAKATRATPLFDRPRATRASRLVGTPAYMSPEQIRGGVPAAPAVDVWGLAVLAYECLTGTVPFAGAWTPQLAVEITRATPVPLSRARVGLPPALDAWLSRALAANAADRFTTVREAVEAYHAALAGSRAGRGARSRDDATRTTALAIAVRGPVTSGAPARSFAWRAALVAAALVAAGIAGVTARSADVPVAVAAKGAARAAANLRAPDPFGWSRADAEPADTPPSAAASSRPATEPARRLPPPARSLPRTARDPSTLL
jgi:eukaryotic-like serine/threonine-protein kinase